MATDFVFNRSMEKEYIELIKLLISERGIGCEITRKELVNEMIKRYKPASDSKYNSVIRGIVDRCLFRLRYYGFFESVERGKYKVVSKLPDLSYDDFIDQYPCLWHRK